MFEFTLPLRVGAESVAQLSFALGLHGQHFAGVIEDRGGRILLRSRPLRVRERTEGRRFFSHADITRDEIRLLERDIEFRFIREFQREDFLRPAALGRNAHQLQKPPDAVLEVNDEVAFVELAEIDLGAIAAELLGSLQPPPSVRRVATEEFRPGKDHEVPVGKDEPARQCSLRRDRCRRDRPMISRKRSISPSV